MPNRRARGDEGLRVYVESRLARLEAQAEVHGVTPEQYTQPSDEEEVLRRLGRLEAMADVLRLKR